MFQVNPLTGSPTACEALKYEEGNDWAKGALLGTGAYSTCYQVN